MLQNYLGMSTGAVTMTGCTFTGNGANGSSASCGGAWYSNNTTNTITSCTFTDNFANGNGGALSTNDAANAVSIYSCIFLRNIAAYVGATATGGGGAIYGGFNGSVGT